MEKKGWKITALVFIGLFVFSWAFMIWVISVGMEIENNDIKCSNEICFRDGVTSYYYDDYTKTCQCMNGDEVVHQEIVGD